MKNSCYMVRRPTINVCYIYLPGCEGHRNCSRRFVNSLLYHKTSIPYKFTVICNGPNYDGQEIFAPLGRHDVFYHDDSGWDIGGYLAFAPHCMQDWMYCFGGNAYVRTDGWLERMVEAFDKHGIGLYATSATYEVRPHLNTSGFITVPQLMASYPYKVADKRGRYEFEHGYHSYWIMVSRLHLPAYMVTTYSGEYSWPDWRLPNNIYRRGDQSNLLSFFTHADNYQNSPPHVRQEMANLSDSLTDELFAGCRTLPLPESLMGDVVPMGRLGGF